MCVLVDMLVGVLLITFVHVFVLMYMFVLMLVLAGYRARPVLMQVFLQGRFFVFRVLVLAMFFFFMHIYHIQYIII
ncbi:MAG TPA: hypothetical protein VMC61_03125 [Methanocella sp.]|nr:hypothetical protein [Methanocella sp.]